MILEMLKISKSCVSMNQSLRQGAGTKMRNNVVSIYYWPMSV
jgi:hypothetical protein